MTHGVAPGFPRDLSQRVTESRRLRRRCLLSLPAEAVGELAHHHIVEDKFDRNRCFARAGWKNLRQRKRSRGTISGTWSKVSRRRVCLCMFVWPLIHSRATPQIKGSSKEGLDGKKSHFMTQSHFIQECVHSKKVSTSELSALHLCLAHYFNHVSCFSPQNNFL